jgi:hypothetical protein
MSQLSELVEQKRAEQTVRLQAVLKAKARMRTRLDWEIAMTDLWGALGVARPEYQVTNNNELVYRVTVTIADKPCTLKIMVPPAACAHIIDEARLPHSVYMPEILDVPTVIERLAEYLR